MIMEIPGRQQEFIWVTHFDLKSAQDFYAQFLELERNPHIHIIMVYISSYGGDVSALSAMRDLIKSSNKPVATIAVGAAMSCGAYLLAAGTKGFRFASKDTRIMIHQVASGDQDKTTNMVASTEELKRLNNLVLENLDEDMAKKKGFTSKEILDRHNVDWYLSAEEAQKTGLIDHVGIPRMGHTPPETILSSISPYARKQKKQRAPRQPKPQPAPKNQPTAPKNQPKPTPPQEAKPASPKKRSRN